MKKYLILANIFLISGLVYSQDLGKRYYTKYYTPIFNDKFYFNITTGAVFPTGICGQQPSLNAYIEDPFKGKTGLGLQIGSTLQLSLKGTPGKEKSKYKKLRFMPGFYTEFVRHNAKWNFSPYCKLSGFSWIALGTGLELGYNYRDIAVVAAYTKLFLVIPYNHPSLSYENGVAKYYIEENSYTGLTFMKSYGVSLRYRKHWNVDWVFRNAVFETDYRFNDNNSFNGFAFPGKIQYSSFSLQIGFTMSF